MKFHYCYHTIASHGMNYSTFIDLLSKISETRMESDSSNLGPQHKDFDLKQVIFVINMILKSSSDDLLILDKDKAVSLLTTLDEYISILT